MKITSFNISTRDITMITSDDKFNNETLFDKQLQQKPWKFCNKKSVEHHYQNINENREQNYYSDEINLPNLENINPSQSDKKKAKLS